MHRALLAVLSLAVVLPAMGAAADGDAPATRDTIIGFHDQVPSDIKVGDRYGDGVVIKVVPRLDFIVVRSDGGASLSSAAVRDDRVRYMEPDEPGLNLPHFLPNDPLHVDPGHWGTGLIGMGIAWDRTLGSTSVKVATIDSGLITGHQDFAPGRVLTGYDYVHDDTVPNEESICIYHGTHTTGTAGAEIDNGLGISGMSQHSILPLKIFGLYFVPGFGFVCTALTSDTVAAIMDAADSGAHVISNSWGRSAGFPSTVQNDAIQYAAAAGAIIVASAGNAGPCTNCVGEPWASNPDQVIIVASTTDTDAQSSFSSEGPQIDLAAPGSSIISTCGPSTNSYCTYSGTSMAAPHVAGAAALLKALYPVWTAAQVDARLKATAVDLGTPGFDEDFGFGRINVDAATAPIPPPVPVPELPSWVLAGWGLAGLAAVSVLMRRRT